MRISIAEFRSIAHSLQWANELDLGRILECSYGIHGATVIHEILPHEGVDVWALHHQKIQGLAFGQAVIEDLSETLFEAYQGGPLGTLKSYKWILETSSLSDLFRKSQDIGSKNKDLSLVDFRFLRGSQCRGIASFTSDLDVEVLAQGLVKIGPLKDKIKNHFYG